MPHNPHADFTPTMKGYSGQQPFRFWCQMALPLTYDDSLSYYELLNKVVVYLNHTIEDVANVEDNVTSLLNSFTELQNYVNEYFDNIDIEAELRNVLDAMVIDGTLDEILSPIVANQLPEVVETQIDGVVAEQIDDAVAEQIDDSVSVQLPDAVSDVIPPYVTDWLDENVTPVGSAVIVDKSLSISGAAADAEITGWNENVIENIANNGTFKINKNILVNGSYWAFSNIVTNTSRGRCKLLIPVKKGMVLFSEGGDFDVYAGVLETPTSTSANLQTMNWINTATAYRLNYDGYLTFNVRNHSDTSSTVDVNNFTQKVELYSEEFYDYLRDNKIFIPRGVIPDNTDLNTVINPGSYVVQSNYTYDNCPIHSSLGAVLTVFKATENTLMQVIRTVGNFPYVHEYQRSMLTLEGVRTFGEWTKIDGEITLYSTGDTTDRTLELSTALSLYKCVKLSSGDFYISDQINLGTGYEIYGNSKSTIIHMSELLYSALFTMGNDCSIHDLVIDGGNDGASPSPTERNAIEFKGTYVYNQGGEGIERGMLFNLTIMNLSGSAIKLSHTGPNIKDHCLINNIEIVNCSYGFNIDYSSEYHRISNCSVQKCRYGMLNNGGNNVICDCDFSGNVYGISMNQSINDSHGSYVGCTFNHSVSALGVENKGTAIKLNRITLGEVFIGCQIYFGSVEINNCVGVRFVGCNVGGSVPFTITDSTVITFSDCTFKEAPDSANSRVVQSGNTGLIYTNCYLRNADVYNPA